MPDLRNIEALIMDCDGVLTNGEIFYCQDGKRTLGFYAQDGMGIAALCRSGVKVAVLSGRSVDLAELRHRELGVKHFMGDCRDKSEGARLLAQAMGVSLAACAMVGDDLADLPAFRVCGYRIAVANAVEEVRAAAHWVTTRTGGRGAVREVAEAILKARGAWAAIVGSVA